MSINNRFSYRHECNNKVFARHECKNRGRVQKLCCYASVDKKTYFSDFTSVFGSSYPYISFLAESIFLYRIGDRPMVQSGVWPECPVPRHPLAGGCIQRTCPCIVPSQFPRIYSPSFKCTSQCPMPTPAPSSHISAQ